MPTLPWMSASTGVEPAGDATAVVMASRFRLRSVRDVLPFLLDAMRVRRQVLASDGALGVSLAAHPLRREFWTLSAWRGRAELEAMAHAEPHRTVMRRYRGKAAVAQFVFWEVPVTALPVSWSDARRRIAAEESRPTPA